MIKHIVFFKIKAEKKQEELKILQKMIEDLGESVPSVVNIEAGLNFSQRESAYDIALVSEFRDKEGLQAYQEHPEHQKLIAKLKTLDRELAVVDYER